MGEEKTLVGQMGWRVKLNPLESLVFHDRMARENATIARVIAAIIGLTMLGFLFVDFWVINSVNTDAAHRAYPWLLIFRLVALASCVGFLVFENLAHSSSASIRTAGLASFLAVLLGSIALILGFYEWFQPSVGYFLAAVFFVSLSMRLPMSWMIVVFAVGYLGIVTPLAMNPDTSVQTLSSVAGARSPRQARLELWKQRIHRWPLRHGTWGLSALSLALPSDRRTYLPWR